MVFHDVEFLPGAILSLHFIEIVVEVKASDHHILKVWLG